MPKRKTTKPYVVHYCRNRQCDRAWIDVDLQGVTSRPATHRYCNACILDGYKQPKKDPNKVARGKALAAQQKKRREVLERI